MTMDESNGTAPFEGPESLETTIARLRHQHHALQEYSRLLASYIPLANLLPLTALRMVRGTRATHSKILRYDADHGDLLLEGGTGWEASVAGTVRLSTDAAWPAGRTFQTRLTTLIADLTVSPEFRSSVLLRDNALRSVLCVPVISGGSVWGVLEVASTTPAVFGGDDERFLLAMANILGVAVERTADHSAAKASLAAAAAKASQMEENHQLRLSEMQHRMKSNLTVVSSMLVMEQLQHTDAYVKERLNGLVNRVGALALVDEQLSADADANVVELAPYLAQLASNLALQHNGLQIETDLEAVAIPPDQATPLGLIVNELLTNAIKYAFPSGVGTIRIALQCNRETKEATLTVADDGVGMGPLRPGSLGTRLMQGLAGQIGGTVSRPRVERGVTVIILFPILA
jgi:two-component sensor histidine kinase